MKTYHFNVDLRCHPSGEAEDAGHQSEILRNYAIAVEGYDLEDAKDRIGEVAAFDVSDAGSRLLDWPLERLEVLRVKLVATTGEHWGEQPESNRR